MRYDDYRSRSSDGYPHRSGARTFVAWLKSRPAESWGFFTAGFVLAALLF